MKALNLPKYLFINGPPGSGKSTLAKLLCDAEPNCWRESFAEPIREMMAAVFLPNQSIEPGPDRVDFRDGEVKKSSLYHLAGLSPAQSMDECVNEPSISVREVMIDFSEKFMKPRFGQQIFGKLLHKRCIEQEMFYDHFIIDDSGFAPEAEYIIEREGPAACRLIHLHRNGCSFTNDSRAYVTLPNLSPITIYNNGDTRDLASQLELVFGNL